MTPHRRFQARAERLRRNARYAVLGFWGTLTFPIRKPRMWLYCRYISVFFFLYYTIDRPDFAYRFGRVWPAWLAQVNDVLSAKREPILAVVA